MTGDLGNYAAAVAIHQFGATGARELYEDLFTAGLEAGEPYSYLTAINRTLEVIRRFEVATTRAEGAQGENI